MTPVSHRIRKVLDRHSDGLSAPEIAKILNRRPTIVRESLTRMPDVYIDRWEPSITQWVAVWCRHTPPANAIKPEVSVCIVPTRY